MRPEIRLNRNITPATTTNNNPLMDNFVIASLPHTNLLSGSLPHPAGFENKKPPPPERGTGT
jgi:hypothetical protein